MEAKRAAEAFAVAAAAAIRLAGIGIPRKRCLRQVL